MSVPEKPSGSTLRREQILAALHALAEEPGKKNITGEVCWFGGTVMVLAFTARVATKDVDALFQPSQIIRQLAREMKCMAARVGGTDEPSDVDDITFPIRHLKLRSPKEVLDLVGQYYPANRIPVKTQYLVEGLFEEGKI